ncbi:transporter substrate-binding domain-containing protein [Piscirickettsia litoralis]|uniref:transporter substrate-binding domain-containing protein n=1 Tax=Piscirickettsia litoralis TaxID=1891921 RepID=UPI0013017402|nr:transporter substrate-binding domain-containing protein [Piscirickettsia litoralis]
MRWGVITITKKRQQQFSFSQPVLTNGKVPLIRCADLTKFKTLRKIDQPDVKIVENLGGTNLNFAKETIHYAQIIIVKNNKLPFEYLLNRKADVMFTDSIEASYRHSLMPELCPVNINNPLTHSNKAYMMQKSNIQLKTAVNKWIANIKNNGQLENIKKSYGLT